MSPSCWFVDASWNSRFPLYLTGDSPMCQITMTFSSKHCSMNKEDELCFAPWVSLNSAAGCTLFSQINFRFVLLHMLSNVLVSSQLPFIRHPGTWGRVAWPVVLALGYQCSLQHPINFFLSLHYHRSTSPPVFVFFLFVFLLPFPWLQINNILRSGFIITLGAGMYVSAAWQEISFIVHLNAEHFNCKYQAIIQRLQKKKCLLTLF